MMREEVAAQQCWAPALERGGLHPAKSRSISCPHLISRSSPARRDDTDRGKSTQHASQQCVPALCDGLVDEDETAGRFGKRTVSGANKMFTFAVPARPHTLRLLDYFCRRVTVLRCLGQVGS